MAVFRQKYSRTATRLGPANALDYGYFTPDDHYEALVGKLLTDGADWCDVGCGRNIFPENPDSPAIRRDDVVLSSESIPMTTFARTHLFTITFRDSSRTAQPTINSTW